MTPGAKPASVSLLMRGVLMGRVLSLKRFQSMHSISTIAEKFSVIEGCRDEGKPSLVSALLAPVDLPIKPGQEALNPWQVGILGWIDHVMADDFHCVLLFEHGNQRPLL